MPRSVLVILCLLPVTAVAQQPAGEGHQLFAQNCAVCHLKPQAGTAPRFGPALDRDTVAGKEESVHGFIATGTERMPGFRYSLSAAQIDAIIAYLDTVPPQPKEGTR